MVGGHIHKIIRLPERIWIEVRGRGSEKNDTCAVYVPRNKTTKAIRVGDKFWWQGAWAFWTPVGRPGHVDIEVPRLSYSGVGKPNVFTWIHSLGRLVISLIVRGFKWLVS